MTPLSRERILAHLETAWLGHELHCFEVLDSTNVTAREMAAAGAPDGTVVIADAQRRGRGRLGREWVSPARKNLYVSIVLR
jgi:BirA family biotin operon repressor/biotin-[acetyl-CoA-carboxylase] ligase